MNLGHCRELISIPLLSGLILVLGPASSFAEDVPVAAHPNKGLVEVHTGNEYTLPYRERRSFHGFLVGLSFQTYKPKNYVSLIDGKAYEDVFSSDPEFPQIEGGYKMNLPGFSLALLLNYGKAARSSAKSGEDRNMTLERSMVRAQLIFDGILPEPYLAPYGSFDFWDGNTLQLGIDEEIPSVRLKFSGRTGSGSALTVGVLLQMNWLEPGLANSALRTVGLENTYIDFFMQKMNQTSSDSDPDVSSDFNWGAGLKLEF